MKLIPILMTAFLGYGCAAKKMAAQNADFLIETQIEKRLPLYSAQKQQLSKDVDSFLNSQKVFTKEALPVLNEIDFDPHQIDARYDKLNSLYKKLALNFSKIMSKHMAVLDQKQQKDFSKNLQEENKDLDKVKPDDRLEKIHDRFKTLFGTMSEKQKSIFEEHRAHLLKSQSSRIERRKKLHHRFEEIYKLDISATSREEYFIGAFSDYQNAYPDNQKNKEILKQIFPTLSQKQKDHFNEKLNDFKEIISYYLATDY